MNINVCGECVDVRGYLWYVNDFEENVKNGCFSDARSVLVDYIEGLLTYASGSCGFEIHRDKKCFVFEVREDDEHMINYVGMEDDA